MGPPVPVRGRQFERLYRRSRLRRPLGNARHFCAQTLRWSGKFRQALQGRGPRSLAGGIVPGAGSFFSGGHSGQASPIVSSPSRTSATAASVEMPAGGFSRAISKARSRACGSARSCIQPCSSHSRMAPASWSSWIAHPRIVRTLGRRSFAISIEIAPAEDESLPRQFVPAANTKQGFRNALAGGFSTRFSPEMPRSHNESVVAPDRAAGAGSGRGASDRCYARLRQRLAPPRLLLSLAC